MTATEQAIQEKELEQLVSLAEAISSKIEELKDSLATKESKKRNWVDILLRSSFFLMLVNTFGDLNVETVDKNSPLFYPLLFVTTAAMILLLLSFTPFVSKKIQSENDKKINTKIIQEQKILGELLNMIHSYKELAYQDMSVVSRAVFEMRLNRIHFSTGENSDSAQFAETVIASIVKNTPFR